MEKDQVMSTSTPDRKQHLTSKGIIIFQLGCLVFLASQYFLEPTLQLTNLYFICLVGFVIQLFLPIQWRKAFFLLLSIAAIALFTGWMDALVIFLIGTTMTAFAVYIRPSWLRISAILSIAAILIALVWKGGAFVNSHPAIFSTIGSMFMFRMMLFLYDRPHLRETPRFWEDLNYFFMLPNMALYLFPVVDYKTYVTKFLDIQDITIYKKGARWMILGLFHLVLYRVVYSQLHLPVNEVSDLMELTQYTISNYLLILRLSGIFHTAAGALCLFGYNLPATFHNYFLASGFSDLWRRINIYFRDFLLKVFYYPIFFKLRKIGHKTAIIATILSLFILTWLLHSFQWFWIKGYFPIRWLDILFWGTFGVLVAGNAIYDMKKQSKNAVLDPLRKAITRTLQVMGMFLVMSVLWSLWSANSLQDWGTTFSKAAIGGSDQIVLLVSLIFLTFILGTIAAWINDKFDIPAWVNPDPSHHRSTIWSLVTLATLFLLLIPRVTTWSKDNLAIDLSPIVTGQLNQSDQLLMVEGYYGEILIGNELTSPLSQIGRTKTEKLVETGGKLMTQDFRRIAIQPNSQILFKGKPFSSNRWGMRDRDYSRTPDPNSIRVLVLGGSIILGSGISDNEVFDNLLEDTLSRISPENQYEFLNLGCPSYDLIDCNLQFEVDSLHLFQPDYLIIFSHGIDEEKSIQDIARNFNSGIEMPTTYLKAVVTRNRLTNDMTIDQMVEILKPEGFDILKNSYEHLYKLCQQHHIEPIWVYWPQMSVRPRSVQQKNQLKELVNQIGFKTIDLEGIYDGYDQYDLQVGLFDMHPNALGHRIIADSLAKLFATEYPLVNRR